MSKEENTKKHINMFYDWDKEREILSKYAKMSKKL